jgi:aliphatic sulfonates family ABC transporter substrate-binding protein
VIRKSTVPLILTILFVLFVGSVFANPPAAAQTQTPLPIKIGYQSNTDWLLFVARDLKLFEKAGLAPTFVKFVAGPPMIAAAQEKRVDVTNIGSVPFLSGLAQGVDWVAIGISPEGAYGEGLVAGYGSGIATVADLPGKRIGFVKGSTAHFGLAMALRQIGIRRDQVQLLDMPPAEQLNALKNNEIDAAMVWEPWMQKMVHEANARVIITEGEMGIYMSVSVCAARRDWLRDHRETAVRFLRALLMASDVMQKDLGIGVKVLAAEIGIKEAWAEDIYENVSPPEISQWTNPRYRYSLVRGSSFNRRLGYLASFLFDEKIVSREIDVRDVLDVSIITEALKTRKTNR